MKRKGAQGVLEAEARDDTYLVLVKRGAEEEVKLSKQSWSLQK